MPRRGVIYTIAPSPISINTIWAGTDDGLIQVTHDGGAHWSNTTPPAITSWSKVSLMEASHTDAATAYAAVNRIRLDDLHPHIYRTHDGGKNWTEIVNGLPNEPINAIREDPYKKGLLFAGSEKAVYVSFDDGDHWQSLRLNMPATSIRDLVIKDDDIVVATHGRSFWILDDITPLRQVNLSSVSKPVILFKPQTAIRVRWNMGTDTPLPQEEPAGTNPPDGAVIDYYLKEKSSGEITLDIMDSAGALVRHFSSNDTLYTLPDVNIPTYWIRPQKLLSADAGSHRFLWDMRYQPLNVPASYSIGATFANTAPNPSSPWVMPGTYTLKLTVNNNAYVQTMRIKMDPRVKTSLTSLKQQYNLSLIAYSGWKQSMSITNQLEKTAKQLKELATDATGQLAIKIHEADTAVHAMLSAPRGSEQKGFAQAERNFSSLFFILDNADNAPTEQVKSAVKETQELQQLLVSRWKSFQQKELMELSEALKKENKGFTGF